MDVAAFLPAEPFEPVPKCCKPLLPYGAGLRAMYQDANAPHALALLRPRCERPRGRRAAQAADEISTIERTARHVFPRLAGRHRPHSITPGRCQSLGRS